MAVEFLWVLFDCLLGIYISILASIGKMPIDAKGCIVERCNLNFSVEKRVT
jgi:hypothetical protein